MKRWRRIAAVVAIVPALALGACGDDGAGASSATPKSQIRTLRPDLLTGDILGLTIGPESMGEALAKADRSFADAVGLYGFRDPDNVLQATLQVTRLNQNAEHESEEFRRRLVSDLGGSIPKPIKVGADTVYVARRTEQLRAVWFRDRYVFVLSSRDTFRFPFALLREAMVIKL